MSHTREYKRQYEKPYRERTVEKRKEYARWYFQNVTKPKRQAARAAQGDGQADG